ncbi:right-handed parallel beta-helix repeat-containing protein [Frigoriflavimonas asaccharolytica]|uniref:Right handed beta helix domain-containing protein n=1 Tax=Frigoriflavimonas asaccharolytica TaxID=2735899 RepID=A0A8J8G5X7_9FLAO|nr:right-handed parallel beta-helix repeat-containing protein [Frigoriflavimonas asaccharolytica]NRS91718.1 hypothetical protein [Frigoriflavimonas asaccharolytica]
MKYFYLLLFVILSNFSNAQDTIRVNIFPKSNANFLQIFQQALNEKKGSVLKITVNKGNYLLNERLFTSRNNTFLNFEKGAVLNFTDNGKSGIIVAHDYFTIKNATIKGNGKPSADFYNGYGILLNGASYAKIINNTFQELGGNNILLYPTSNGKSSSNNLISNNNFSKPASPNTLGGDQSAIMLGYSGENYSHDNNIIENNIIDGNNQLNIGIAILGHGNHNIIRNNTISNVLSYGILAYESKVVGNTLDSLKVIDNTIKNVGEINAIKTVRGMGIYLMTATNAQVSGNKVSNVLRNNNESETLGAGAISLSLSPGAKVYDNVINGSYMYGIVSDYSFGSKFYNNEIFNTRRSGLYLINVNDVEVYNNTFSNIGGVVFRGYFENSSLAYIKEQLRDEKYKNIDTGNNISITNNKINSNQEILYFNSTSPDKSKNYKGNIMKNITFTNNEVSGNTKPIQELVNFRGGLGRNLKVKSNRTLR